MRGGTISARAEMWPAATGQHQRCGRRGDRRERGRGRRAGGAAMGLWVVGQWAAGRRRAATSQLVADSGDDDGQRERERA